MGFILRFTIFLLFISCASNDINPDRDGIALASDRCGNRPDEMVWLDNLIKKAEADVALSGNIYAVRVDNRVIIVHQPAVMSCMGCIMYDCEGDRVDGSTVNTGSVIEQMTEENLVYTSYD